MRLRTAAVPLLATGALLLTGCSSGGDEPSGASSGDAPATAVEPEPPEVPGMIVLVSDASLPDTVGRLEGAVSDIGRVVATVEEGEAVLVIGGNAGSTTPILQQAQPAGLDLPQRYLVWEDAGVVYLGYDSADWIAQQAGIGRRSNSLDPVRYGSAAIAAAATGAEPVEEVDLEEEAAVEETTVASDADVAETVRRLQAAAEEAGAPSPVTVDHAAGSTQSRQSGAPLRATTVTFAGVSDAGAALVEQTPTTGLDLPLRFLVAEGEDGTVGVTYVDVADIAARHGADDEDAVAALAQEQQELVGAATASGG